MAAPAEWRGAASAIAPGHAIGFQLGCGDRTLRGFVVHHHGAFHAYLDRCPHVGSPLEIWPNEFLSEDGRWLVCATHGALFEPATGLCTDGPCVGDRLARLPLRRVGDTLIVSCPPAR